MTIRPFDPKRTASTPSAGEKDGLLAWWKFEESEGTVAVDTSEHHLNGQIKGATRWAPTEGPLGGTLEFDGTSTFLQCEDVADFDIGDRVAVALWYKARPLDKADAKSQVLLAKGEAWQLHRRTNDGQLAFSLSGPLTAPKSRLLGGPPSVSSKRNLNDNQWHHVVGIYDGKQAVLYVDGEMEDSIAAAGVVGVTTAPLTLGEASIARGRFFSGWMDDARVYNRSLSLEEVRALCAAGRRQSAMR